MNTDAVYRLFEDNADFLLKIVNGPDSDSVFFFVKNPAALESVSEILETYEDILNEDERVLYLSLPEITGSFNTDTPGETVWETRTCPILLTNSSIYFDYYEEWVIDWDEITSVNKESGKIVLCFSRDNEKHRWIINPQWLTGSNHNVFVNKWMNLFTEAVKASKVPSKGEISNYTKAMNTIDKKKIEYVIGIDLGHGETSAAICPIQWDTEVELLDPVKDLEMGGNKKVLPSAITILDNGNAYIGDAAFAPEILKQAHVHVCFKQAPKDINGEPEKLMIRFMKEVYNRIRQNNSAMLTDDNHLVYIATPSGWDKSTQALYVEMAKSAGLPMGGVTKESRAAFVRAQNDVTSGLGRNIEKGAIVFDMGSSTLDFTYMNKNLPNLIDNGYDCGASFIEKAIFADKEAEDNSIQLFEKKYPDLVDFLVFEARKVKEQVYFDTSLRVKKSINYDDFIEDDDLEDERFKLVFQPGELNSLLMEKGYFSKIRDAMLDYRENHIPGQKIYGVFMTGGASRMDFLKDLVCECWKVDKSQVFRDQDPSLTISEGVAEVARMDLRTEGMDEGLEDAINRLQNGDEIYNTFIGNFGFAIYDKVTDDVAAVINYFGSADDDYSINNLIETINEVVNDATKEITENASAYLEQAVSENLSDIQKQVESIVKNYSRNDSSISALDLSSVSIPKIADINMGSTMKEISESISASSSDWGATIGGAAVGAGIALLLGGPLAWLVGGGAALASLFFGKTEEEKKAEAKAKLLDKQARSQVVDSIAPKWEGMMKDIENSINKALHKDKKVKESINHAVRTILQEYKEILQSARILID